MVLGYNIVVETRYRLSDSGLRIGGYILYKWIGFGGLVGIGRIVVFFLERESRS